MTTRRFSLRGLSPGLNLVGIGAVLGFTVPFLIFLISLISLPSINAAYLFGLLISGVVVAEALWLTMWIEGNHKSSEAVPLRFSLRTLLIAMTLVSTVLGLIVYVLRQ